MSKLDNLDIIANVCTDLARERDRWAIAGAKHSDARVRRLYSAAAKAVGRVLLKCQEQSGV